MRAVVRFWLICRISSAFDQSHAGAQAVHVPLGTRKVSQVRVPSDSGLPSSSAPPRANSALA
jgi:hypothetical protein